MLATRSRLRLAALRAQVPRARCNGGRFQSTSSTTAGSSTSHFASGLAGGIVGSGILYLVYSMTPSGKMSKAVNQTAREVNKKYNEASKKLQESTPDADQAINSIKDFCYSYVSWVPGGRAYVDGAFKDLDTIREKHGDEVKKIVNDGYRQLADLAKSNPKLNLETVTKTYDILADITKQLGELAGDAATDLLDNHPELKDKFGDSVGQIKAMGEQFGPEAKKQVDETWATAKEIVAGGFTAASAGKLQKLFQDKREELGKLGDRLWDEALEKAQPYLDKSPEVKQLVQDNASALKQGNFKEILAKAKSAVDSGNIGDFEQYIRDTADKLTKKAGDKSSGLFDPSHLFDMLPQAKEIQPKLQQLMSVAKDNAEDGQKLLKETIQELKKVIEEKSKEAEKLANKAKEQAK